MKIKKYVNIKLIFYDFALMGANAFVPLIGAASCFGFLYFLCFKAGYDPSLYISASQSVLPLAGSWWVYHLLRPILEDDGGELYLTLPTGRLYLGAFRASRMWLICTFLLLVYCFGINKISGIGIFELWSMLSIQSLFFFCAGFACSVATKSPSECWLIPTAYSVFYLVTKNNYMRFFSIYIASLREFSIAHCLKIILFSAAAAAFGVIFFKKV